MASVAAACVTAFLLLSQVASCFPLPLGTPNHAGRMPSRWGPCRVLGGQSPHPIPISSGKADAIWKPALEEAPLAPGRLAEQLVLAASLGLLLCCPLCLPSWPAVSLFFTEHLARAAGTGSLSLAEGLCICPL